MRASDLREMTRDEILRKLTELRDEQFKLRLRRSAEELPNPLRLRLLRHDVARCLTVLRAKDNEQLADIVTTRMVALEGIRETQTLVAFRAYSRFDLDVMFNVGLD